MQLSDTVAVVTGGASGLGQATVEDFVRNGAKVAIFDLNEAAGKAIAERHGANAMFAKVDVNGDAAEPLYKFLKKAKPGLLGSEAIKWNFTKFLVDRKGNVVERYAPNAEPASIAPDIEKLL